MDTWWAKEQTRFNRTISDVKALSRVAADSGTLGALEISKCTFFPNRVINRWNSLDQQTVDAKLNWITDNRMGFFMVCSAKPLRPLRFGWLSVKPHKANQYVVNLKSTQNIHNTNKTRLTRLTMSTYSDPSKLQSIIWRRRRRRKCNDLKCVRKPTKSRLSLTHHANKSSRWAE